MRRIKREEQREKQGLHHSAGSSSQTEVIDLEQDGVSVKREAQDGNPRPKKAGRGSSNTHVIELD